MPYSNLPDFVKVGSFCLTLKNTKNPYDPFKLVPIGATDDFYPFDKITPLLKTAFYRSATLGLKVGSNNISAIDIDGCVNANGEISDLALDIISRVNAYTELSPSGTGIRILFQTNTHFEPSQYYVKNTKINVEYYDAYYCNTVGARMVRLSGNVINPGTQELKDTLSILNDYMTRPPQLAIPKSTSGEPNPIKLEVLKWFVNVNPNLFDYNQRTIDHLSESEWDCAVVGEISRLTNNQTEIMHTLESSRYFRTKDRPHMRKWGRLDYVKRTFQIGMSYEYDITTRDIILRELIDAFDTQPFDPSVEFSHDALVYVLYLVGIIKSNKHTATYPISELMSAIYYAQGEKITLFSWHTIQKKKKSL